MSATVKFFKSGWALWLLLFALLLTISMLWLINQRQHDTPAIVLPEADLSAGQSSMTLLEPFEDMPMPDSDPLMSEQRVSDQLISDQYSSGQFRVITRPGWTLDTTLLEQLNSLKIAADSGDNKAAYILGMNLRNCSFAPVDDSGLQETLQDAYQFNDHGATAAENTARYQFCLGVDKAQRNQFYTYLAMAASRGYVPAQEAIAMITPEQYMQAEGYHQLERDDYIAKRSGFVQQQVDFLTSAAQHGSIRALIQLSQLHYAQTVGEDGRLQAYAFNQIILQLTDDNALYNRYNWFQERAQSVFTQEEMDGALNMAEQWLKIISANGTLYLHTD